MKLIEIALTTTTRSVPSVAARDKIQSSKQRSRNLDNTTLSPNIQKIGQGADAVVFINTRHPAKVGTVQKWVHNGRTEIRDNGTINWLIQSNKTLSGNTFVPICYQIKQIVHPTVSTTCDYMITMEKLIKIQDIDYTDPLIGEALVESLLVHDDSLSDLPTNPDLQYHKVLLKIVKSVCELGSQYVEVDGNYRQLNPQLIQAAECISKCLYDSDTGSFDIRLPNIMIRRTSTGNQVVIVDPIIEG